ncbi:MAG: hypothetical protein MUE34_07360 [Acidimicrobiales bacterium]|nr:hypothetical protein [Acidimicrobiales bacterium]
MSDTRSSPDFRRTPMRVLRAIGDGMLVGHDDVVTNWVTHRPALADPLGNLRLGAITFVADGAGGLAGGLACDEGRWVVTTDLEVRLLGPVTGGRVRIEGRVLRVGSTTVVCDLDLFDDATGARVGAGSITNHALETPTAPARNLWTRGVVTPNDGDLPPGDLADLIGLRPAGEGAVEVPMSDEVRNPWGIMHGGVVAIGAEEAVLRHPAAAGGSVTGMLVRYLSPTRTGPARFEAELLGEGAYGTLFRVRATDVGAGRTTGEATVTITRP